MTAGALALDYSYRYQHASVLDHRERQLRLATFSPGADTHPYFFTGQLIRPRRVAEMLRGLMKVVQTRFHVPAAMLGRILAQADPVVTCHREQMRLEGFSGCCGVYVRVDLLPDSVRGETLGCGTTNVDFNAPMLAALATVRETDDVSLSVGSREFALTKNDEAVVEKKVALPVRWLKGFVEVQACQSRMQLVHEVSGNEARRFLRGLPRMKTNRRETFVVAAGRGLRISQIAQRDAVRVGGLERLRVLEELAADAETLRIYSDAQTGASAWELAFEDSRFHLVISPEVWRGFSGEGQVLTELASADWQAALPKVRAKLKWQAVIPTDELAARMAIAPETVHSALAALGSRGLVGFDLHEAAYFHRELPFDLSRVEQLHPRLKNARKLIDEGRVRAGESTRTKHEFWVRSSDVEHRVTLTDSATKCTCPWYSKHGTARGPCKHILAVQITLEEQHGDG